MVPTPLSTVAAASTYLGAFQADPSSGRMLVPIVSRDASLTGDIAQEPLTSSNADSFMKTARQVIGAAGSNDDFSEETGLWKLKWKEGCAVTFMSRRDFSEASDWLHLREIDGCFGEIMVDQRRSHRSVRMEMVMEKNPWWKFWRSERWRLGVDYTLLWEGLAVAGLKKYFGVPFESSVDLVAAALLEHLGVEGYTREDQERRKVRLKSDLEGVPGLYRDFWTCYFEGGCEVSVAYSLQQEFRRGFGIDERIEMRCTAAPSRSDLALPRMVVSLWDWTCSDVSEPDPGDQKRYHALTMKIYGPDAGAISS